MEIKICLGSLKGRNYPELRVMNVGIYIYIYKVKFSRYRPSEAKRVGRDIALLFHDRGTRRG